MEKNTLVNCGKEMITGTPPEISSRCGQYICDIDYVGSPGVKLELGIPCGWKSIWCRGSGCRYGQIGKITTGIRVHEE